MRHHSNRCPPIPSMKLLKKALQVYHTIYGNYDIPEDFTFVPSHFVQPNVASIVDNKAILSLTGLKLGMVMMDVRVGDLMNHVKCRELFNKLNINIQKKKIQREKSKLKLSNEKFSIIRDGLIAYKKLHGNLIIAEDFVIPTNSTDFPSHTWGYKLGQTALVIKRDGCWMHETYIHEMREIGIVNSYYPNEPCRKMPWGDVVKESLEVYHKQHGNLDIPSSYIIQEENRGTDYPSEMIGCDLGMIFDDIKNGKQYNNRKLVPVWRKMGILPPKEKYVRRK